MKFINDNFRNSRYIKLKDDIFLNKDKPLLLNNDYSISNMIKKNEHKQLLHIIIIKINNNPIASLFNNIDDYRLNITIISKYIDNISHYNIKKVYIDDKKNYVDILNNILTNNNSKYYMILYNNYHFENNFLTKILNYLNNTDLNMLILYQEQISDKESSSIFKGSDDYFNVTFDFFKKNYNNHLCIINNNIKRLYSYSITEVGMYLYIYDIIINNNNNIIGTINYKYDITNNNIEYIKDILLLFNKFFSNIENNLLKYKEIDNNINNIDINEPLINLY